MSEELKLTLTPDTAAAAAAPTLTLEPDAAQDQSFKHCLHRRMGIPYSSHTAHPSRFRCKGSHRLQR